MVDGTGLENQRTKVPQVRILSLPPNTQVRIPHAVWDFLSCPFRQQKKTPQGSLFSDHSSNVDVCACRYVYDYYYDFVSQLVLT